jgi:Rieske Fe-S protein
MVHLSLLVLLYLWIQAMSELHEQQPLSGPLRQSRRALLAGACVAGAAALAGCTTYDANNGGIAGSPPSSAAPSSQAASAAGGAAASGGSGAASAAPANLLTTTEDVPVGGGKIIPGPNVVVTQPVANTYKGFSAVCTHQGCIVATIANGTIDCPCHGSQFSIKDGSVVHGPAPSPLPPVTITVQGTSILKG